MVSGSGLASLYAYVTGENVAPRDVPARLAQSPRTVETFARFYGRAARNYALAVLSLSGVMVGYGYTAIVVAWLARLKPWPIAFTSFLLASLRVGVEVLELKLQIPAAFGQIMEGGILLCVIAGQFFLDYTVSLRRPEAPVASDKSGKSGVKEAA